MKAILYPGSFDPITKGHIDVILRLRKIFDRVVVLVADSSRKNYYFKNDERIKLIQEALGEQQGIEVRGGQALTVTAAKEEGINLIARSMRTSSDCEHELNLADANKKLKPDIETLFIMADPKFAFISSTLVREIASFRGDTSEFVPENVARALAKKGRV
ncbi:MAG: pantetheine-phosphate adenylyltransferase [Bdellovibrionales bacterium RBG_16_40_8]|nr:MAG: pantetheine-phosphate adenylyltransferase [Bdellovibrionales bacterium RBG_16_40_8]